MPVGIDSLNSSTQVQQVNNPSTTQAKQELSPTDFLDAANKLLDQSVKENWCPEYLADRLYQLVQENPQTVKELGFPSDYASIKKEIVEPWYEGRDGTCKESQESKEKAFGKCLKESQTSLFASSLICGASIALLPTPATSAAIAGGVVPSCGSLIVAITDCWF